MNENRLKLGILIDSYDVPAWAYCAIKRIVKSDFAEIAIVILNDNLPDSRSKIHRYWGNRNHLVYAALSKIDAIILRPKLDAFVSRNLEEILRGVPSVKG